MMEKMLSFEEWEKYTNTTETSGSQYWKDIFDKARQGVIPADRAIEVPPVSEWPEQAKGIVLSYTSGVEDDWSPSRLTVGYFSRPTPQWSPKEGEPCLFEDEGRAVAGFIFNGQLFARGLMVADWKKTRKTSPFRPEVIGLSWGEI